MHARPHYYKRLLKRSLFMVNPSDEEKDININYIELKSQMTKSNWISSAI